MQDGQKSAEISIIDSGKPISTGLSAIDLSTVRFVFLDRDGVINRNPAHGNYVLSFDEIEILPGVERAIALLNQSVAR